MASLFPRKSATIVPTDACARSAMTRAVRSSASGVHARGDASGPPRGGLRPEAQPVRPTVPDHPHALPLEGFLMETKKMETKKVLTYVDGLDEALGGGLPAGHVVLVSGLPGTMKSTLSYSILHRNATERGARGLYVSLEQTRKSLEDQMSAMGLDVEAVRGDVHILDVGTIQKEIGKSATKPWMEFLRRTLTTKKDIDGIDLIVIDSLEALEVLAKFSDRRTELFQFFEWLRDLGATTLVLTEAASEAPFLGLEAPQPRRDETFLADGILELKMHPITDVEVQRRVRLTKMRGSHHKTGFSALSFEDGRFQVTSVISV